MAISVPADESTVDVNEDPIVRAPSQMVTSVIYVEKTCDSDQQDQQIWYVRRQIILGIWVMLLPIIAFVEVYTVTCNAWIKQSLDIS